MRFVGFVWRRGDETNIKKQAPGIRPRLKDKKWDTGTFFSV
jgi:hypothetical protein